MKQPLKILVSLSVLAISAWPASVQAAANLVVNGGFDQWSQTASYQIQSPNNSSGATLTGWTNAGYTFLFTPGTADSSGATNSEYNNTLTLWGPNDGSNNGLTASSGTGSTGGNFIGSDGAYQSGAISQSISGLTVGGYYSLSFAWAAAQQQGYTGATTEAWQVSFGSQTFSTPTVNNVSQGFVPWMTATMNFTATAATQTLSFLAIGSPSGTPPFSLLDSVSLTAAPEPSTWAIMLAGLAGVTLMLRRARGRAL